MNTDMEGIDSKEFWGFCIYLLGQKNPLFSPNHMETNDVSTLTGGFSGEDREEIQSSSATALGHEAKPRCERTGQKKVQLYKLRSGRMVVKCAFA